MAKVNASDAFVKSSVRELRGTPWEHNWSLDCQPGKHTAEEYQDISRRLRIAMLETVRNLMSLAPSVILKDDMPPPNYKYYTLKDIDGLIAELKENPSDTRFLKSAKSVALKMWEPNVRHDPANIGDYLRFQILCDEVADIVKLRDILLRDDSPVTSYKDQFRRPCQEGGHRAFKFHIEIKEGNEAIVAEGQLCHRAIEELDITKHLRASERDFNDAIKSRVSGNLRPTLLSAFKDAAEHIQGLRRAVNHDCATNVGLNVLLDRGINPEKIISEALESIEGATGGTGRLLDHCRSTQTALGLLEREVH